MASEKAPNMAPKRDLKFVARGKTVEITNLSTSERLYGCAAPRFSYSATLHRIEGGLTEEAIVGGIKLDGCMGDLNFRIDPNIHPRLDGPG